MVEWRMKWMLIKHVHENLGLAFGLFKSGVLAGCTVVLVNQRLSAYEMFSDPLVFGHGLFATHSLIRYT